MGRLIRKYNAGERVTLSEWTREHGTALSKDSSEEVQKEAIEQARQQLEQMRRQLDEQLAQSDVQSAAILEDAQMQAVTLQAEAQAKGYEAGYKQGLADGQQKMDAAMAGTVTQMRQMLGEVASQRNATLAAVEGEIVALSLAIAEKIVGHIAATHEEVIIHIVNRAIAELTNTGPLLLRVHPDDGAILERYWQGEQKSDDPANRWRLLTDPHIERGGCLVVCGSTTIDAHLSTQLQNIAVGLRKDDKMTR